MLKTKLGHTMHRKPVAGLPQLNKYDRGILIIWLSVGACGAAYIGLVFTTLNHFNLL